MYVWNEKVLIMIYGARAVEQRESAWVWQSAQDNDRLQRGSLWAKGPCHCLWGRSGPVQLREAEATVVSNPGAHNTAFWCRRCPWISYCIPALHYDLPYQEEGEDKKLISHRGWINYSINIMIFNAEWEGEKGITPHNVYNLDSHGYLLSIGCSTDSGNSFLFILHDTAPFGVFF